ncbi:MAG: phosphatase PAP2 family protein [Oscillospiraceae bacterium]|nr:phosphatase PAP2 family protein [Oscillospiraceae bacterium]
MGNTFYFDWEVALMEWLQSFEHPVVTALWTFFTMFGETAAVVAFFGIFYWGFNKELGKKIGFALFSALCMCEMIKSMVLRRRPYMDNDTIKCIRPAHSDGDMYDVASQGYSCPSAHSAMSSAFYGSIGFSFTNKIIKAIGFALPVMVALSRLYLGVHYPTDVLGGLVTGFLFISVTGLLGKKVEKEWIRYAVIAGIMLIPMLISREKEFTMIWFITVGLFGGFVFESKYVKFEDAKKPAVALLRFAGGLISFGLPALILRVGMKAILGADTVNDPNFFMFCLKGLIVGIPAFMSTGIYPILIKKLDKTSSKAENAGE